MAAWLALEEPRPRRGYARRKPETAGQIAWHWTLGWGLAAAVVIGFGPQCVTWAGQRFGDVAAIGWVVDQVPLYRISGQRERAARIDGLREAHGPAEVVVNHYGKASLLAFYLKGQPGVYSAAHQLGSRRSAYDFFEETDLRNAGLLGGDLLLVGGSPGEWEGAFRFDSFERLIFEERLQVYLGRGYGGVIEASDEER